MINTIVIFGASGDLTSRFLFPAIVRLHQDGRLPEDFRIIGIARDKWDTAAFRRHLEEKLTNLNSEDASSSRTSLLESIEYLSADVTDRDSLAGIFRDLDKPLVIYLALPPALFHPTVETLKAVTLPQDSKLVLEKPFGTSLASAQALNRLLHESFPEQAVFRLDHFLGKQTVQNIVGLRFGNRIFEPLWSAQHIERVSIVWDETLTVTGRGRFYDETGALRDMIQNHLLQLLALIAMEPLQRLNEQTLRDRKLDVFRAVRRLSAEEIPRYTIRGRYGPGTIDGRSVPGYVEEEGVNPGRHTETFAQVQLAVDNWRWAGVPFLLRTGKALGQERREIAIHFKSVPHMVFGQHLQPQSNVFKIQLKPDRIMLSVNLNASGDLCDLQRIELDRTFAAETLPPYARLLLDVLEGDSILSIRDDETEESWRIVEPILSLWGEGRIPLAEYPAGSDGPANASRVP
jgi:glucose-6-phosphate 1-dehydrogenase